MDGSGVYQATYGTRTRRHAGWDRWGWSNEMEIIQRNMELITGR